MITSELIAIFIFFVLIFFVPLAVLSTMVIFSQKKTIKILFLLIIILIDFIPVFVLGGEGLLISAVFGIAELLYIIIGWVTTICDNRETDTIIIIGKKK